jgi:hypothetical protein
MKEALGSSETSVLTRSKRRNIPEDSMLQLRTQFVSPSGRRVAGSHSGQGTLCPGNDLLHFSKFHLVLNCAEIMRGTLLSVRPSVQLLFQCRTGAPDTHSDTHCECPVTGDNPLPLPAVGLLRARHAREVTVWCGVVWCGVVWCGVVGWCGVCGVVWCGVVWCGVGWGGVWCGVVWCGVM